jgi:hypothetical protein
MYKFGHINSVKDLDNEILKTELKKRIIKDELALQAKSAREMLKPSAIGRQLLMLVLSNGSSQTPASILLKAAMEIFATVEASKYGFKLLKKVFS